VPSHIAGQRSTIAASVDALLHVPFEPSDLAGRRSVSGVFLLS
jgi:hypothetical protein